MRCALFFHARPCWFSPRAAAAIKKSADANQAATEAEGESAPQAASVTLSPGEWELTSEMLEMNIPGMPAGAMPKEAMQKTSVKTCLTPEQTEKPDAGFFSGQRNPNCTYDGFEMTGGTVSGTISCKADGGTQKMTIAGTYESENYDMRMEMQSERMSMKMHTSGKRVGDCPS